MLWAGDGQVKARNCVAPGLEACYPKAYVRHLLLRSPPPPSHKLALGNTSASDPGWTPIWGQALQPWMCRPRGLSDLHGDLITRSHSWSLPKRFSAFRPQTANRQSSFPPRFVNNLRGPEGPSPYPGSTFPVSFCLLLHPTPCLWRNPLLLAACRGLERLRRARGAGTALLLTGPQAVLSPEADESETMQLRRTLGCFRGADIRGAFSWVCCTFGGPIRLLAALQSCEGNGGWPRGSNGPRFPG